MGREAMPDQLHVLASVLRTTNIHRSQSWRTWASFSATWTNLCQMHHNQARPMTLVSRNSTKTSFILPPRRSDDTIPCFRILMQLPSKDEEFAMPRLTTIERVSQPVRCRLRQIENGTPNY